MDNGNEIEKNVAADSGSHSSDLFSDRIGSSARVAKVKSSIQDFLEQESRNLPTEASGVKYDLAEEYAATKSNGMKNLFPVLLWMLAAFLFVGIMAVTIVSIVNRQNRKIEVEVESFDNLNLSNLLDLVSGTQSQINEESANKANLEAQRKAVIEQAESARKSSLATLESMNLKDASERRKRESEIQSEYQAAIASVAEIDAKIAESEQKISLYQQQLAQYDTTTVQQAREHQAEMDSEKQLHQLEKQKMTKEYEGKITDLQENLEKQQQEAIEKQQEVVDYVIGQYDPTFADDGAVLSIVKKATNSYARYYTGTQEVLDENASDNFKSALRKQQGYFNEISTISSRFLRLPQKNAIPSFASSMQKIANSAGNELAVASVAEVNSLLGKKYELEEKNRTLETEKSNMATQIEGLEGEKKDLISKNETLTEEKTALEGANEALSNEKNGLSATNEELAGANAALTSAKDSLESEKAALTQELESLNKEKGEWESIKAKMESDWAAQKKSMEDSWAAEKSTLIAERDSSLAASGEIDSLRAEKDTLSSANAELSAESEKLRAEYDRLVAEKKAVDEQNSSLKTENKSLSEANKSLSSQGSQYSDLMQALCVRDGKKIQGFVSGKVSGSRMQIYVEKSAYSSYASKASGGALVPVAIVRGGKIVAVGKLSVDNGSAYIVKGSEEDQIMVESILNLAGANDYSAVNLGDEIQISNPL